MVLKSIGSGITRTRCRRKTINMCALTLKKSDTSQNKH